MSAREAVEIGSREDCSLHIDFPNPKSTPSTVGHLGDRDFDVFLDSYSLHDRWDPRTPLEQFSDRSVSSVFAAARCFAETFHELSGHATYRCWVSPCLARFRDKFPRFRQYVMLQIFVPIQSFFLDLTLLDT